MTAPVDHAAIAVARDGKRIRSREELLAEGRADFDRGTLSKLHPMYREAYARAYADIAGWPHHGQFAPKPCPIAAAVTEIYLTAGGKA